MLNRLAGVAYHRRWLVLVAWVVVFVGITAASRSAGSAYAQSFRLAGVDSQVAADLLKDRFPARSGVSGELVFAVDGGVDSPGGRDRLTTLFTAVKAVPGVKDVRSPFADTPAAKFQIAPGGRIGYAQVQFDAATGGDVKSATLTSIRELVATANADGVQVEQGGGIFGGRQRPGSTEGIGLLAAVVILLLAFGSVIAMGLPIGTALFGIGVGFGLVGLASHVTTIPEISTQLGAMIGIGVGIDYALFIVTRYRQGLHEGLDPEGAVRTAIDTAGRAVLFAGTTVVISLAGMMLIGIEFIQGLGIAAALVVLVTMVASLTLLPALLGFSGRAIDKLRIPGLGRTAATPGAGFWVRWSRWLQRHPWPAAVAGFALLLALAAPVLHLRLGSSDDSALPTTNTVRRAYDLKAEGFGAGASGPLLLVAELPPGFDLAKDAAKATPILAAIQADPGVAQVSPPQVNPAGDTAVVQVIPKTSAQDAATTDLIHRLREDVLPAATAGTGITVHVGGVTAFWEDLAEQLQRRLPVFIGVVLALSFLLLLAVFRSVLVPLKAVVMNLLSIGAAYGVIVAVFQDGIGASLVGVGTKGPIEAFVPMMMFAILFGLSMDYEVFLLSRIKEEHDRTGDNSDAVTAGLGATARVITAAALIMVMVFGAFVFGDNRVVKEFGLGLSVAVLIDATIVRMVLVPATMELLGSSNWWFPKWLTWLPQLHVEGTAVALAHTDDADPTASIRAEPAIR